MHVLLGELSDAVERTLQLLLIAFQGLVAGVVGNWDEFSEAHQDAGKRFRDDQAVPGVQHPSAFDCDVKRAHGNGRGSRQSDWAWLHFVARTAGTIDAEGYRPAFLQGAAQAEQGADGVAAAGAFDGHESESVDDSSHVFAVVAIAAHDADSEVTKKIGCGDDAGVPEIEDERALAFRLLRAFFARDADAQGGADQTDEAVSGGDDDAQEDSLAEGEARNSFWGWRC